MSKKYRVSVEKFLLKLTIMIEEGFSPLGVLGVGAIEGGSRVRDTAFTSSTAKVVAPTTEVALTLNPGEVSSDSTERHHLSVVVSPTFANGPEAVIFTSQVYVFKGPKRVEMVLVV